MKINILATIVAFVSPFVVIFFTASTSQAHVVINPNSDFAQYESYGMYFDPQSDLYLRSGGNAWGALGGAMALLGFPDLRYPAQLIIHGSANASYRLTKTQGMIETKFETIDARVGLSYDMAFTKKWRMAIIWTHESGHISDNIADMNLFGLDVGNEAIDFRVIHDIGDRWRIGGGLKPYVMSHPNMKFLWAEQFVEWHPMGASPNPHVLRPYFAAGLIEGGVADMNLTVNIQAGIEAENHFLPGHTQGMRALIGYYAGNDPRMKYLQYLHATQQFLYGGFAFDL